MAKNYEACDFAASILHDHSSHDERRIARATRVQAQLQRKRDLSLWDARVDVPWARERRWRVAQLIARLARCDYR